MKRYLIDASVLTAYLYQRTAAVNLLSPWISQHEAATSILVYGEIVEHLQGRRDYPLHRMERYATIRRQLRLPHGPGLIGDVDTLIAATALERNLTVVTADSDFERVPGLKVMVIPKQDLARR